MSLVLFAMFSIYLLLTFTSDMFKTFLCIIICQSVTRTQILQSPAHYCRRTKCYIGRHMHQHRNSTRDSFIAVFVLSLYGRLSKLVWWLHYY